MFISQGLRILARSSFSSTHISPASTLIAFFPGQINAATYSNVAYFSTNLNEKRKVSESSSIDYEESPQIVLTKENIPQSPWKMRFLVTLIRDAWVPDALAQMKFTPKKRSEEIAKILNRGVVLAKLRHDAIAEELRVKEVIVTKGLAVKRMRIMGRGRSGVGYKRKTHVRIVLEKINFPKFISSQETFNQKMKWKKREKLVQDIKAKAAPPTTAVN